ncbi:MAG: cytochrome c [Nitrospirae bacterium]|nr:MAG: cytochrome c [Nitrospirota bacterium]
MTKHVLYILVPIIVLSFQWANNSSVTATDLQILSSRVISDQLVATRKITNPFPASPEFIAKGKSLYFGKGFCVMCHGRDGRGLEPDQDPGFANGMLPRDFTDQTWQRVRTDGELLWILENGSPGTAMPQFVPRILTEEEAWQVLLYVRSLGRTAVSNNH